MHEDPTRMMGQPDHDRPNGNMRLLVAGLIAVIVGLLIAIFVIADSGDSDGTTATVTTLSSATTDSNTETTTGSTTETTSPTTTETTSPTTTETTTTSPPEEEENGSGGIGPG
jgi:eukaryotic-like serine/threonine-protein kinase